DRDQGDAWQQRVGPVLAGHRHAVPGDDAVTGPCQRRAENRTHAPRADDTDVEPRRSFVRRHASNLLWKTTTRDEQTPEAHRRTRRSHSSPTTGSTSGMNKYPAPKYDHTVSRGKSPGESSVNVPTVRTPSSSTVH